MFSYACDKYQSELPSHDSMEGTSNFHQLLANKSQPWLIVVKSKQVSGGMLGCWDSVPIYCKALTSLKRDANPKHMLERVWLQFQRTASYPFTKLLILSVEILSLWVKYSGGYSHQPLYITSILHNSLYSVLLDHSVSISQSTIHVCLHHKRRIIQMSEYKQLQSRPIFNDIPNPSLCLFH